MATYSAPHKPPGTFTALKLLTKLHELPQLHLSVGHTCHFIFTCSCSFGHTGLFEKKIVDTFFFFFALFQP